MPNMFSLGLLSWAGKRRFPTLFALTAVLFVITLVLPDPIPLLDEIVFGLATLLLGSWKKRKPAAPSPVIDAKR